ncbi:MAG: hypothetical protein ACI4MP_14225, partial [Candidatus Ventricola sp.]
PSASRRQRMVFFMAQSSLSSARSARWLVLYVIRTQSTVAATPGVCPVTPRSAVNGPKTDLGYTGHAGGPSGFSEKSIILLYIIDMRRQILLF